MRLKPKIIIDATIDHQLEIDHGTTPGQGLKSLMGAIATYVPTNSSSAVIFKNGRKGCMLAVLSHIRAMKVGYESRLVASVADLRHLPNSFIHEATANMRKAIVNEVFEQQFRGINIHIPAQVAINKAQLFCQHKLRLMPQFLKLCVADRCGVQEKFLHLVSIAVQYALGVLDEFEADSLVIKGVKSAACIKAAA